MKPAPRRIPVSRGTSLAALVSAPPKRKGRLSTVVFSHGFCGEKTERGLFSIAARVLREHGYATVLYDWRGLGESDGDFGQVPLETHAEDYKRVVEWTADYFGQDSDRVCGIGFSLGASVIALGLQSGLCLAAAAFWSPALRPAVSMWPRYSTPELREQLRRQGYILKPETGTRLGHPILNSLRTTDAGVKAFDIGIPLLVCHGTNDARIPVDESRKAYAATRRTPVYYAEFHNATHSFSAPTGYREQLADLLLDWLARTDAGQVTQKQERFPRSEAPHPPARELVAP